MRADRSRVQDLFGDDNVVASPKKNILRQPKKKTPANKGTDKPTAMQNNKMRFLAKLENEAFSEFDEKDWFQYFVLKASEQGVRYLTRNYAKEYAVIKSIQNELPWADIKNMIDFLFESEQDMIDKRTLGLWALSKGWINSVYQNTTLWIAGEYKPKSAPKRNREWTGSVVAEASSKKSGTGLMYGKPIKDEPTGDEPKKPKGRIHF